MKRPILWPCFVTHLIWQLLVQFPNACQGPPTRCCLNIALWGECTFTTECSLAELLHTAADKFCLFFSSAGKIWRVLSVDFWHDSYSNSSAFSLVLVPQNLYGFVHSKNKIKKLFAKQITFYIIFWTFDANQCFYYIKNKINQSETDLHLTHLERRCRRSRYLLLRLVLHVLVEERDARQDIASLRRRVSQGATTWLLETPGLARFPRQRAFRAASPCRIHR